MIPRWSSQVACLAGLALAAGCSIYDSRYDYPPGPVDVMSAKPGDSAAEPVHTLISMRGVRKEDAKSDIPASVEVMLRVENTTAWEVTLEPKMLSLFSADLSKFPEPILVPLDMRAIAPGGSAVLQAFFPFPDGRIPGDFDLDGLNVQWTLKIDGQDVTSSATFCRFPEAYYERYPNRVGVGFMRYDY